MVATKLFPILILRDAYDLVAIRLLKGQYLKT
jgi:hypothetical protein